MYHNGGLHNINTRYIGCFWVRTYGKHIFTESGLVPDEPHQDNDDGCIQYIPWNGNLGSPFTNGSKASGYKVLEGIIKTRQRLSIVAIDHDVHQQRTIYDQLGCQSYDKWM